MSESDEEFIRAKLATAFEHVEALEDIYGVPRPVIVETETLPPQENP
jgi:hypothetical protein